MDEQEGIEGEAVYGRVGPALPEWSASLDLLVLGSRGYGTIGRLINGSMSRHLARNARCALLVLSAA